jgi:hypothetical protein
MNKVSERLRASVHESGHCVAAHLLGVRLERVQVTPRPRWVPTPGQQDQGQASVIALAGSAAEEAILGDADARGGRRDRKQAERYALSLNGPHQRVALSRAGRGEDDALQGARRQAREVIQANAGHVAALAAVLAIRGRLSGDDIAAIIDQPPPRQARLGLAAAAVVKETADGDAWYEQPRRCSRRHFDRQVEAGGDWYRALVAAARTLFGRRSKAVAMSLADHAVDAYPSPPTSEG